MKALIVFLSLLLMIGLVSAEEVVISNSAHGLDVITAISYANSKDLVFNFMTSVQSTRGIVATTGSDNEVILIQSENNAFTQTIANDLRNKGNTVEVYTSSDPLETNLDFAKRSGVRRFILVDTTYGYNPLSVIPYAAVSDTYILLVDESNALQVGTFLRGKATYVLQYGYLDDAVKAVLGGIITEVIDTGDKYKDNLAIVDKYLEEREVVTAILSDAAFLELGSLKGDEPIIMIASVIPEVVQDYILESDFESFMLIGGDLVPPVQNMKQNLEAAGKEVKVLIKFGQTTLGVDTGVKKLDVFPLPTYPLNLVIESANYNEAEGVVEVVYVNKVNAVAYVMADIQIEVNGQHVTTIGDEEPLFIGKGATRGQNYALDLADLGLETLDEAKVNARVLAKYGGTKTSLETVIGAYFLLTTVTFEDTSNLNVTRIYYDSSAAQISLTLKNTGDVDVYYLPSFELQTGEGPREYSMDVVGSLGVGKSKDVIFSGVLLTDDEIARNSQVDVHIEYGARFEFLTNTLDESVTLEVPSKEEAGGLDSTLLIIVGVVALIAIIVVIVLRRKPKKKAKK